MKHSLSQLFPVILLALLAAASFWLQKSVEHDSTPHDKTRHEADSYAENTVVRGFDETGALKYQLTSPNLVHYSDDGNTELKSPVLISYRPDALPVTITGNNAVSTANGETVYLWDNVNIIRAADAEHPELHARMPNLTTRPNDGFGFTDSPVEITLGDSWIKGVGAQLDNKRSTLVLQSQVTGLYIRKAAP